MSRSDHNRSRRHPASKPMAYRIARAHRRQWQTWVRNGDDGQPYPVREQCGYGCQSFSVYT